MEISVAELRRDTKQRCYEHILQSCTSYQDFSLMVEAAIFNVASAMGMPEEDAQVLGIVASAAAESCMDLYVDAVTKH